MPEQSRHMLPPRVARHQGNARPARAEGTTIYLLDGAALGHS